MALAKALRCVFAIGVSGAEVGVAARDPIQEVLVGHLRLSSGE
jgi:hypothetical protein